MRSPAVKPADRCYHFLCPPVAPAAHTTAGPPRPRPLRYCRCVTSPIRLSFCIPTRNFGQWIGETLESIHAQAPEDVEIVVVDGASTDDTEQVVERMQRRCPRLVYDRRQANHGVDGDLAHAVAHARGNWVWLMSSDDVLARGALTRVLDEIAAARDGSLAVMLGARTMCDVALRPLWDQRWLSSTVDGTFSLASPTAAAGYFRQCTSIGGAFSYLSSILVRRSFWDAHSDAPGQGSNFAHAFRILRGLVDGGGLLKVLSEPIVQCRGDNDSFAKDGALRRFLIDLEGYELLARSVLRSGPACDAFYGMMRREHPWSMLPGPWSRATTDEERARLRAALQAFHYPQLQLTVAEILGAFPGVVSFGRRARRRWRAARAPQ